MIIITLRTDKPEAEIGLNDGQTQLAQQIWLAHRQLAETIHTKLRELLQSQDKDWPEIQGIVCYQGPGSFTGLRIGLTVANALAYSYSLPIIAEQTDEWLTKGIERLLAGETDDQALPLYGADAHISLPRK